MNWWQQAIIIATRQLYMWLQACCTTDRFLSINNERLSNMMYFKKAVTFKRAPLLFSKRMNVYLISSRNYDAHSNILGDEEITYIHTRRHTMYITAPMRANAPLMK